jgi:hypothetical protein
MQMEENDELTEEQRQARLFAPRERAVNPVKRTINAVFWFLLWWCAVPTIVPEGGDYWRAHWQDMWDIGKRFRSSDPADLIGQLMGGMIFIGIPALMIDRGLRKGAYKTPRLKKGDALAREAGFKDEADLKRSADESLQLAFSAMMVMGDQDVSAEQRARGVFSARDYWNACINQRQVDIHRKGRSDI